MMRRRRGMGLIGVAATTAVVAGTAGAVQHKQQQKYANQAAQQQSAAEQDAMAQQLAAQQAQLDAMAAQQAAPAAPAAAPQSDVVAQLTQLKQLVDAGILTPEEFEAKKKQLLGI